MTSGSRRLNPEEAAAAVQMEVAVIWRYADLALITLAEEGLSEADLAELRRVRRLRQDLELDHPAIEIILRLRQRIETLQAELRDLELAWLRLRRIHEPEEWRDGEWEDL